MLHLAEAARRRDPWAITTALRALVQHEEKKKGGGIAEHLRKLIPHAGGDARSRHALKYLDEIAPRLQLDELMLDAHVREACAELILEQRKAGVLAEAGLSPRNRVLLTGPPGNGKTSLAEAIATALSRPFYVVGYDTLTGSYLGQTGGRLREVVDYVGSHECVALFDEFEAIAKERDDRDEVGEMKRVVASLLVQLERMPPSTVIVAATNHPGMLDRATWRRFQIRLELEAPDRKALTEYFESRCRQSPRLRLDASSAARTLEGASYAEAAEFCDDVERQGVLCPEQDPAELFRQRLARWTAGRGNHPQHSSLGPAEQTRMTALDRHDARETHE